jgi:hypothetical protein
LSPGQGVAWKSALAAVKNAEWELHARKSFAPQQLCPKKDQFVAAARKDCVMSFCYRYTSLQNQRPAATESARLPADRE